MFFFTWIVLPWLTRTRCRSSVSSRRAGNRPSRATSSANRADRPRLRRAANARTNCTYASRLAKSRLPRNNSSCPSASLKRRWPCSQSPFSWPLAGLVASATTP